MENELDKTHIQNCCIFGGYIGLIFGGYIGLIFGGYIGLIFFI